jgi:hypothetical protein
MSARQAHVEVDRWLQGEQPRSGIVLLLIFQVNCPGCFLHALPTAIELHRLFGDDGTNTSDPRPISTSTAESDADADADAGDAGTEGGAAQKPVGTPFTVALVSTAFEDFEKNTLENTQALLDTSTVIGETRKALGADTAPFAVPADIPVAFDKVVPISPQTLDEAVAIFRRALPEDVASRAPPAILRAALEKMALDRGSMAKTFDGNTSQGTPTWVLYDTESCGPVGADAGTVLHTLTGHMAVRDYAAIIGRALGR